MNDSAKTGLDVLAGANAALALMQWLPPLAALLTIVWTAIRIYEWWKTKKVKE